MLPLFLLVHVALADATVDTRIDAAADVVLGVELECGSITIRGAPTSSVHVTGTVKPDLNALEISGSGKRVSIELDGRRDHCAWLTVEVPAGASLRGEGVSASFDVDGVSGNLRVESVSGKIDLKGVANEVEVESVSGAVLVQGTSPRVEVESVSGEIRIETVSAGTIEAATVSSSIKITSPQVSEVSAASVSGDIKVKARIERAAALATVSGDISLDVPADQGMQLSTSTFSGSVSTPLDKQDDGTIGDGSARVEVESFSGRIVIEAR